ncbi:MAG: DUF424 family protein [Thermofilaceae archaeon]|nr:DUF424 family protein [Thermofilaceae archaeon]MCX8180191.1 DUF424 family protein [Thermofilaceae archaeon]MDW8004153.1 DUF424 family protein [Thermofilaceae archaeon]
MADYCYVKVHRQGEDVLVAVCDEELLDKKINVSTLVIHVSKEFYGGERIPIKMIWDFMKDATIVNAIGNAVVSELAERIPAVHYAAVNLGGIPHVQLLLK